MKKLFTLLALALLTTACVSHDVEEEEVAVDPYYAQQSRARTVVVQQPQRVAQQPIVVQAQQPVQQQTTEQ